MKCPSFEQIYDMDLENLLLLKKNIEQNKINFNTIPLNEDDYDLYDNNSPNDKESVLNLVNSEIKERESTKELLNFFSELNFENNIESKFLQELNFKSNDDNKKLSEIKNKENIPLNKDIITKNIINKQPIKLSSPEDIKSFLNRTKIDPNKLQYKVSSNKFIDKFWSIDKEKKLRKKNSYLSDISSNLTNFSSKIKNNKNSFVNIKSIKGNRSRVFSEKIVIGAIDIKKEKVKKKKKKIKKTESKKINTLELRRNYKVSDVTQFLKKKTSLKPLNISNNNFNNKNLNKNNCFNNEINPHNIKILNKKNIQIKNDNKSEEENKIQENKNINEIIKEKQKIAGEEKKNNIIIQSFDFSFVKGYFRENKYDSIIENLNEVKINNKENIIKRFNKDIDIQIIKNISIFLTGNKNQDIRKSNISMSVKNKMNFILKEDNLQRITEEKKDKIQEQNLYEKNYNKIQEPKKIIFDENKVYEQKKENNNEPLNIDVIGENKYNKNPENTENLKEIEQLEEYEEIEEEIEQNDFNTDNKQDYLEEFINNKKEINQVQTYKNDKFQYSLNPIRERKLNMDKKNSKENFFNNLNINKASKTTQINDIIHQKNNILTQLPSFISNKKSSNGQEFKKYVLSSVKPPKTMYHYSFLSNKKNTRPKSSLSNNIIVPNYDVNINTSEMVDYSDIYSNFAELFSGYYLTNNYSEQNHFNLNSTIRELYDSFNKLYYYELNHDLIRQKDEMYQDIARAEAGVIINRIKHAQERLLKEKDINTNVEKYCLLKKCLELERKNYARNDTNDNIDIDYSSKSKYKKFFRVVYTRPEIYDIVCYTLFKNNSWSELPHGLSLGQCWNLYWSYCPPNIDFSYLFAFQKVNHLINNRIVHRKDLLHKHIMRVRNLNKRNNEIFDIMPLTFLLSKEYVNFVEEFHKLKETDDFNIWIVKPVGKSRGKGIFLIDNISDVPLNDTFLVQKYLSNPLLLDEGYKFDMRIYCLVTSVNPLEMFLYKDGFARVSNELYSMDISNIKVHLTNAAIQNRNAKKSKNYEKIYGGSKISLDMLRTKLSRQYNIDFDYLIWPQVKDIIIKVFACCQNDIPYCPSTFEMFGFDVIIDSNYRCWLLEINSSPSLERSNVLDDEIKIPLVEDIIKIVDPADIDKLSLINVLERNIKIKNNYKNKDVYLYSPKIQLNIDLNNIFMGKVPRKYGEMPKDIGRFEMICPSKESDKIIKMAGGQKLYNNKKGKDKKK